MIFILPEIYFKFWLELFLCHLLSIMFKNGLRKIFTYDAFVST